MSTPSELLPALIALPIAKIAHPSEIVFFREIRSESIPVHN